MFFGPFFPSPFTDLFSVMVPRYRLGIDDELCGKLTRRFYACLDAYGTEKSKRKCKDLLFDMLECHNQHIQRMRIQEIRRERRRKYKAGEIEEEFSEKPPMDSYLHL